MQTAEVTVPETQNFNTCSGQYMGIRKEAGGTSKNWIRDEKHLRSHGQKEMLLKEMMEHF